MTLLNTPMPADKIYKIVESIFYSNMNTKISVSYKYGPTTLEEILTPISYGQFCDNDIHGLITINSVTPIVPKYSVGDKVLILSTGEIGEIEEILDERLQNKNNLKTYGIKLQSDKFLYWVHRSQIAKLPNDL